MGRSGIVFGTAAGSGCRLSRCGFIAEHPATKIAHGDILASKHKGLQLWGGVECTINRVRDHYYDQNQWSGHRSRVSEDLQQIASVGVRTLRTALHWEQFAKTRSWDDFDRMLGTMQRLEIQPIVGLVHHGSGPAGTDLLDPAFPEKLASYACQVARRYPWIRDYTPVNEPHTTSRFSCLYGHWYPHHRNMKSYVRALLHEIKATVLAMRAVRMHQPEARLIYTEDGGSIFSVPELEAYRVEREHRRWLGTDLLCGMVTLEHPLYEFLLAQDVTVEEIGWFAENPCPPDVLGLNYYVTSDRFLDNRVDQYPDEYRGGDSGFEPLVDVEALRVRPEGITGVGSMLKEAWERYGIPVAITEAHLGDNSDNQIRWLAEVWQQACAARDAGVDVCAVTVWALLGSWNWCSLCTRDLQVYEPGVFNVSGGHPVPTPLAAFVEQLAQGYLPSHPALAEAGWWTRADRVTYPPFEAVEDEFAGATSVQTLSEAVFA